MSTNDDNKVMMFPTDHSPYVGHEISFRRFKAKVDRFCVFTDDDTSARIISSGEKEIIEGASNRH